jgi:NUAK family SNF1-like kinase
MESLAFPRRSGPAPSAAASLTVELAGPLADGLIKSPKPLMKKQAVKRHHHKHNLRHRYEFLETLGKGTYGKVKKARESSGRLVSASCGVGRVAAGRSALLGGVVSTQSAPS